jgi:hypothetical protein
VLRDAGKRGRGWEAVFRDMDAHQATIKASLTGRDAFAGEQVYKLVLTNIKNMHPPDGRSVTDQVRLDVMLSVLGQWQKRLAPALLQSSNQ